MHCNLSAGKAETDESRATLVNSVAKLASFRVQLEILPPNKGSRAHEEQL